MKIGLLRDALQSGGKLTNNQQKSEPEPKSIFDENFKYNKIPLEVYQLRDLNSDDREILSRIIFWTRRSMPCTHTNAQFAELINKSESTAYRIIQKLRKKHYADAYYWGDEEKKRKDCNRELTALVGVDYEMVVKRLMKNAEHERRKKAALKAKNKGGIVTSDEVLLQNKKAGDLCTSDEKGSSPVTRGGSQNDEVLLYNNKRTTIAKPSPSPAEQAQSSQTKKTKSSENLEYKKQLFRPPPKLSMSEEEFARRRELQKKALGVA